MPHDTPLSRLWVGTEGGSASWALMGLDALISAQFTALFRLDGSKASGLRPLARSGRLDASRHGQFTPRRLASARPPASATARRGMGSASLASAPPLAPAYAGVPTTAFGLRSS